jgi:hypothetical protein
MVVSLSELAGLSIICSCGAELVVPVSSNRVPTSCVMCGTQYAKRQELEEYSTDFFHGLRELQKLQNVRFQIRLKPAETGGPSVYEERGVLSL